jgi:tRNA nucleotidyltransferase/poly(A) polymerase
MPIAEEQRRFAVTVVNQLRAAGFEAYWAGGCVRDQLLGRVPKDFDVATNALPEQVRAIFGRRRTLAIGAAFGVIAVIGSKAAGMVEVTTFRRDAAYSDGRHPDSVTFSSAEEDASRRDFTVNGLFYDPIEARVIDFVGGQKDLAQKHLRAIGPARQRFAEDKLRMLRAVRFAATFGFTLDDEIRSAIREMAGEIHVVSPERIAMEMRRLLADPNRAVGVRLMLEITLAKEILPEIVPHDESQQRRIDDTLAVLQRLGEPCDFPPALAALLQPFVNAEGADVVCGRWRLSNKETERVGWLVENHAALAEARSMQWSAIQPFLIADGIDDLLRWMEAVSSSMAETAAYCRTLMARPREQLDPPPLLTGSDLLEQGIPSGPQYKTLLQRVRAAQLDGEVFDRSTALAMVEKWLNREERGEGRGERA